MKPAWAVMAVAALGLFGTVASAVEVSDYAVYANGTVKVTTSVVGDIASYGGDVDLNGRATVFGSAVAGWDIAASSRSVLYGDATAGGDVVVKGIGRVKGATTPNAPSGLLDTLLPGSLASIGPIAAGGASYKGRLDNLALTPGSYGDVKLSGGKGGGELVLSAGDYYFSSLSLKRATVLLDLSGGSVNVYVQNGVSLSRTGVETAGLLAATIMDGGAGSGELAAGLIYLEADGAVKMSSSDWLGTIFAPYADMKLTNTSIVGALYGGQDIGLKGRVSDVIYAPLLADGLIDPADPDYPDDPQPPQDFAGAPEPSTLALLAAGLMGALARTLPRRKRSA